VARPKHRATEGKVGGEGPHDPGRPHRTVRILALSALTLVVVGYAVLYGYRRQSTDRSPEAYCGQIASVTSLEDALGNLDAQSAQDAFARLEDLDRVAPTDIEPQLRVVVDASRPLVVTLQTTSPDQEQALRQVLQARQPDMQRVDSAAKAMEVYTSATCHRDLETTVSDTAPDTALSTSTTAFAPAKPQVSSTIKAVPPPKSTPR
jgi:hypothetical protein